MDCIYKILVFLGLLSTVTLFGTVEGCPELDGQFEGPWHSEDGPDRVPMLPWPPQGTGQGVPPVPPDRGDGVPPVPPGQGGGGGVPPVPPNGQQ